MTHPLASPSASPMALAEAKMHWLDRRQRVLAQNIANADTPRYQGRDVTPFGAVLSRSSAAMARTNIAHLEPTTGALRARVEKRQSETSPNGNAISLDEQALKIADNDQQHQLATMIYRRFSGMFHTALGKQ